MNDTDDVDPRTGTAMHGPYPRGSVAGMFPAVVEQLLAERKRLEAELAGVRRQLDAATSDTQALLHEVWLAVHIRRFAVQEGETGKPDSFYAGVIDSEHAIAKVAEQHGVDWRQLRKSAAALSSGTDRQDKQ